MSFSFGVLLTFALPCEDPMATVWRSCGVSTSRSPADEQWSVATVLVVEDERDLRQLLRRYLERSGFAVLTTPSGAEAIALADRSVDLVLLDLGLPDVDGIEVLAEIRRGTDIPVVVLTARSEVEDRIRGLEQGADDYVAKPFSPREVVLRVRAVLGRRSGERAEHRDEVSLGSGRLRIRAARHEADLVGRRLSLTPTEWGLLTTLAGTPGRVFSRYELVNRVRGYEFDGYERSIDSHVKNLRRKLHPLGSEIVVTVAGAGYQFGWDRDA
jgi:DNA-binding response OmpR family regulator